MERLSCKEQLFNTQFIEGEISEDYLNFLACQFINISRQLGYDNVKIEWGNKKLEVSRSSRADKNQDLKAA